MCPEFVKEDIEIFKHGIWLKKAERLQLSLYSKQRQLYEGQLMGIFKEQDKREIIDILKDSQIKHENMTLGNLFAFCKLEKESKAEKFKEHDTNTLKNMLQSELIEDRELAEGIINS